MTAGALKSLYDLHSDGSGVALASARRPMVNMRPRYHLAILDAPHAFSADLHIVDWLEGGSKMFDYQALYRWISGALHLVFGDSSVGETYVDASCLLAGSLLAFLSPERSKRR